jgi:endonuclease V-like protein UPF0215 family
MTAAITNVIGFDDAPFLRTHRGRVRLVATICARTRLDGVISGYVTRDGTDSTTRMTALVRNSPFAECVRAVLLQGIAVAGFNVVDIHRLSKELLVPVLVVIRHKPNMDEVKTALLQHVPSGERKWRLIEQAGEPTPLDSVWVQRSGISLEDARALLRASTLVGNLPEPLRLAHIIGRRGHRKHQSRKGVSNKYLEGVRHYDLHCEQDCPSSFECVQIFENVYDLPDKMADSYCVPSCLVTPCANEDEQCLPLKDEPDDWACRSLPSE